MSPRSLRSLGGCSLALAALANARRVPVGCPQMIWLRGALAFALQCVGPLGMLRWCVGLRFGVSLSPLRFVRGRPWAVPVQTFAPAALPLLSDRPTTSALGEPARIAALVLTAPLRLAVGSGARYARECPPRPMVANVWSRQSAPLARSQTRSPLRSVGNRPRLCARSVGNLPR